MCDDELVSRKITFLDLCTLFDAIKNSVSSSKRQCFDKFLKRWRDAMITHNPDNSIEFRTSDSIYPAFRLLTPNQDNRAFGIREARLNTLVCKTLMIKPLEHINSIPSELLISKLVAEVEKRFVGKKLQLSIHQVNESLDRLLDSQQKESELRYLFMHCSNVELRWLMHIIISDVEHVMGIPHSSTILGWLHRDADQMLRAGDSLKTVCEIFTASGDELPDLNMVGRNLLCKPFRPMLLKRLNYSKYCLPKIIKVCGRPFYMELKYDGEHIMVHKYNKNYKYFTRNGIDYTAKLGADNNTRLSAKIDPYFVENINDCVLDCELLIYDTKTKCFVGKNRRARDGVVYDAKHFDEDFFDNGDYQRCLAVFDVLYLNGRSLVNLSLQERITILNERVFDSAKPLDKSCIFLSEKQEVNSAQQFVDYYNHAMRNGEEGVVVKSLESKYKIGSRAERNGWFKIKPDYGVQSGLDLAIVAVRFENNSSNVRSFLVAAAEGEKNDLRFRIVAVIVTHMKKMDFIRLMELLRRDTGLIDAEGGVPEWIETSQSSDEKLDKNLKFVSRQNIQVVEVRASGLINGRLQFPSISCIRTDKFVEDIDTVHDICQFDQRLRLRPMVNEDDEHEAVLMLNRKRRVNLKLKENCKLAKKSDVDIVLSNALKEKKICVVNGNELASTKDLQKILLSFNANLVANAGKTTDLIVAMNIKHIRCAAAIKANQWNVINGEWLIRCRDAAKLLPWKQSEIIHLCPTASFNLFEEKFSDRIDGSPDDEDNLQLSINYEVDDSNTPLNNNDNDDEDHADAQPVQFIEFLCDNDSAAAIDGNLFEGFVFFIHKSIEKLGKVCKDTHETILKQQGRIGSVLDDAITHVLVGKILVKIFYIMKMLQGVFREFEEVELLFKWNEKQKSWNGLFVSLKWIEEVIKEQNRYVPTENLLRLLES